jgi:hypothetical protein
MPMIPSSPVQKSDIKLDREETSKPDGSHSEHSSVSIGTEDIIAIGAVFIAALVVVAMIAGWLPINKWTIGLAGFSATGAAVAKIAKAKNPKG